MKKIAQAIVRLRKMILILAVLLLIPSAVGAIATRINYDILSYLPPELDSRVGQLILEDDYQLASTSMITVEGLPTHELLAMKQDIDAIPGVLQTFWLSDVVDPAIPVEMLPADVQKFLFGKNDSTILIVRLGGSSVSEETMEAVAQIKKVLRHDCYFGGMSVILQDTKALINEEMPLYILCAVGASMLVLFLSLESTITPVLFMLGLLFPIVYNFGTNIFLGQISYITQALSTVLQLGVTMDFAMGAAGINTIATLLIAFLRPTLIGMLYGRENAREGGVPSSARFGERIFVGYLVALTLIHHAVFFSLEALSWIHLPHTLLRIAVSSAVSVGFIWIIARIFTAKIPVRI